MKRFKIVLLFFRLLSLVKKKNQPVEYKIDGLTVSEESPKQFVKTEKSNIMVPVQNSRVAFLVYAVLNNFKQGMYGGTASGLRNGEMSIYTSVMFDEEKQLWYRSLGTAPRSLTLKQLITFLEEE